MSKWSKIKQKKALKHSVCKAFLARCKGQYFAAQTTWLADPICEQIRYPAHRSSLKTIHRIVFLYAQTLSGFESLFDLPKIKTSIADVFIFGALHRQNKLHKRKRFASEPFKFASFVFPLPKKFAAQYFSGFPD